jgi:hypothetical protein
MLSSPDEEDGAGGSIVEFGELRIHIRLGPPIADLAVIDSKDLIRINPI